MLPRASFFQLELEVAALQLGELFFFIAAGSPVWDDCFDASFSLVEPFVGEEEGIWAWFN